MHRTVLVPPPVPAAWSGLPRGRLAVTAAESLATWARQPDLGPLHPSTLMVSRSALETTLRFRPGDGPVELRAPFETIFLDGAVSGGSNGIRPPVAAFAFGFGLALAWDLGGGAYVGALLDGMLLLTDSPYLDTDPDGAVPGSFVPGHDGLTVGLARLAFAAGWHCGPWRIFGMVTARNHPALSATTERYGSDPGGPATAIDGGPAFLIWTLGLDVAVTSWLSVFLHVHEPIDLEATGFGYAPIVTGGVDAFAF